jgi:catechol 2,3-dioxygenase-like lactoylglutathione lyase family enzyme
MAQLDHLIVPSRNRRAAAELLARLLDVPWEPDSMGMFSAVYVNPTLTIDFGDREAFDVHHYCFMLDDDEFDAVHRRLIELGVPYRSSPRGPIDMQVNTENGKNLFWFDEDGHNWEILTVSYARQAR